jgi:hypothetical protein
LLPAAGAAGVAAAGAAGAFLTGAVAAGALIAAAGTAGLDGAAAGAALVTGALLPAAGAATMEVTGATAATGGLYVPSIAGKSSPSAFAASGTAFLLFLGAFTSTPLPASSRFLKLMPSQGMWSAVPFLMPARSATVGKMSMMCSSVLSTTPACTPGPCTARKLRMPPSQMVLLSPFMPLGMRLYKGSKHSSSSSSSSSSSDETRECWCALAPSHATLH